MEGCKEAGIPCFGTLWDFVSFLFSNLQRYITYHITIKTVNDMASGEVTRSCFRNVATNL